jgi:hypothetical protein
MRATCEIISVSTVPFDYSWDYGIPSAEYGTLSAALFASDCFGRYCLDWRWLSRENNAEVLTTWNLLSCGSLYEKRWNDPTEEGCTDPEFASIANESLENKEIYIGYAPLVSVTLSSELLDSNLNQTAALRVVDFGDYYNSESSTVKLDGTDKAYFCHNFIMPGTYKITLSHTEYIAIKDIASFECLGRHCLDWKWLSRQGDATFLTTWSNTSSQGLYEKRWDDPTEEGCVDFFSTIGFYSERSSVDKLYDIAWQWYNFLSGSDTNLLNRETTWDQTVFQGSQQLTWNSATDPCIDLNFGRGQVNWNWDRLQSSINSIDPRNRDITWLETNCENPLNKTWLEAVDPCIESVPELFINTRKIDKEIIVKVLEIPPIAYLNVLQPANVDDRVSPMQVQLSPRFTQCGSFPIDKIIWDLGDGSPLIVQRRWSPTYAAPFVFTNTLSADYKDPRNYDIIHTYRKTANSGYTFYPSITAYSSSTGTTDCCSAVVGPLKLEKIDTAQKRIKIIQNNLNQEGQLIVGQVGDDVCVWKTK